MEGIAENLPLENGSRDIIVFSQSLHHVPVEAMKAGLDEANRVLVDHGFLYVLEPVASGPMYNVENLIDDEAEIRGKAQDALSSHTGFILETEFNYETSYSYESVDVLIKDMADVDPERMARAVQYRKELETRFDKFGVLVDGVKSFNQPNNVKILRKA